MILLGIGPVSNEDSGESAHEHILNAQTHQSLCCLHIQSTEVDENTDKNLDI